MASQSVHHWVEKYDRLRNSVKRAREHVEGPVGRSMEAVATVAGGAAVGAIDGMFGTIVGGSAAAAKVPGTNIELSLAVGAGLQVIAIMGMAGKYDSQLNNFAAGMLAVHMAGPVNCAIAGMRSK